MPLLPPVDGSAIRDFFAATFPVFGSMTKRAAQKRAQNAQRTTQLERRSEEGHLRALLCLNKGVKRVQDY